MNFLRPAAESATVLITDPTRGHLLVDISSRDKLLVRLHRNYLDEALAAGAPPAGSRLLAVRAGQLTEPAARRRLAAYWDELLVRASTVHGSFDPRVPLPRGRIKHTAHDIRELTAALRASRPVAPAGVAVASQLLTDGAGPVYNPRCRVGLATAVRAATGLLEDGQSSVLH